MDHIRIPRQYLTQRLNTINPPIPAKALAQKQHEILTGNADALATRQSRVDGRVTIRPSSLSSSQNLPARSSTLFLETQLLIYRKRNSQSIASSSCITLILHYGARCSHLRTKTQRTENRRESLHSPTF